MSYIKKAILQDASFMMLMAAGGLEKFYSSKETPSVPPRPDYSKPYPQAKSLPKWKVGETIIHAKNEKDAIKYAKKRGVWKDGMVAVAV